MADSISMSERQLSVRLRADAKGSPLAVKRAMFSAAHKARSFIIKETPVDRGLLRVAWKVIKLSTGVELVNDQPYAGVMERGARPFKISKEGLLALRGWVRRKILASSFSRVHGSDTRNMPWKQARQVQIQDRKRGKAWKKAALWALEDEVKSIAYAIAKSFEKVGMKGKFFVMKNLTKMAQMMDQEFVRSLNKFFSRPLK